MIDVAAGPGGAAVMAARRGVRVLATDIAPAMVERAAERLRPYEGCSARVMSFDDLKVPDGEFDVATSLFGLLSFAAWRKGLTELARVTRRGGRVAATAWTAGRDVTSVMLVKRVFEARFPDREFWPDGFFPSLSPDGLAAALREAGCDDVEVHVTKRDWSPRQADGSPGPPSALMANADAGLRNFPGYRDLSDAERDSLREPVAAAVAEYAGADGVIRGPGEAYAVIGRRG